jgi:hypothetical protein
MRLILGALLGGFVLFMWGFVSHMMLPLGEMGMKFGPGDDSIMVTAMQERFTQGEGVYLVPSFDKADHGDQAKMSAWAAKAKAGPYAVIMYTPQGVRGNPDTMMPQLPIEFATNVFCALLVSILIAGIGGGYLKRVGMITVMGVFAGVAVLVPYWNWYYFPTEFVIGGLISHGVGWLLAGLAIAAVVKPTNA